MLPSPHRMTNGVEFTSVVRDGRRAKTATLVLHHRAPTGVSDGNAASDTPARVGLVVSKAVGGSVVRHRVSRRLRAQLAPLVANLPAGSGTVVRALPPSARASSRELAVDLGRAFAHVDRRSRP